MYLQKEYQNLKFPHYSHTQLHSVISYQKYFKVQNKILIRFVMANELVFIQRLRVPSHTT